MNKFKLLLISVVFLPILLAAPAGVAFAGPLDLIYDAPGNVWGRVDSSIDPWGQLIHTQANIEQGIRFYNMRWVTFYGGFTWWQEVNSSKAGYWQAGIKNTTWISNWTLGIEEQDYVVANPALSNGGQHFVVAYVSTGYDWNLRKY